MDRIDGDNKGQGMKEKCAKCKENTDQSRVRVAEGKAFFFCEFCDAFLSDHMNLSVRDYLGPKFDTWVSKNIQSAHKLRLQKKSPWSCQPDSSKREDLSLKDLVEDIYINKGD